MLDQINILYCFLFNFPNFQLDTTFRVNVSWTEKMVEITLTLP